MRFYIVVAHVAIFEDNSIARLDAAQALIDAGHAVVAEAPSPELAIGVLGRILSNEVQIDVIIQDGSTGRGMPGDFARTVVAYMREHAMNIPILGFSAEPFRHFNIDFGEIDFTDVGKARVNKIGQIVSQLIEEISAVE